VAGISFRVPHGEIFGLLGPNSAGKSTTIRTLTGQINPTQGSASVAGCDVVKERQQLKARIGTVFDEPNLYERLSAPGHHQAQFRGHDDAADHAGDGGGRSTLRTGGLSHPRRIEANDTPLNVKLSHGQRKLVVTLEQPASQSGRAPALTERTLSMDAPAARVASDHHRCRSGEIAGGVGLSGHPRNRGDGHHAWLRECPVGCHFASLANQVLACWTPCKASTWLAALCWTSLSPSLGQPSF
jgi:ABC-type oligopeptide transport system ATPase subunit